MRKVAKDIDEERFWLDQEYRKSMIERTDRVIVSHITTI